MKALNSLFLGLVLGVIFMLVGCGSGGGTPGGCTVSTAVATNAVTVKDFSFDPSCIKVNHGDTVTWTNTGMASHTVTSDSGAPESFDSGALGANGTFHFAFTAAGTVPYHCIPHQSQGMTGTVIVQ